MIFQVVGSMWLSCGGYGIPSGCCVVTESARLLLWCCNQSAIVFHMVARV